MGLIVTEDWSKIKIEFLSGYNFKMQLESYILRIERQMAEAQPIPMSYPRFFYTETRLPQVKYKRLGCLCVVNSQNGDFSPVGLFFVGEQAICDASIFKNAYLDIKQKLGW